MEAKKIRKKCGKWSSFDPLPLVGGKNSTFFLIFLNPSLRGGRLQCHHQHRGRPHLRLAPLRLEILSESPSVGLLHTFLTGHQCREMRDKGRGKMKATPLTVLRGHRGNRVEQQNDQRTSKVRYISHRNDTLARQLNNKISETLNLDLNGHPVPAENYQLMNYGLGEERVVMTV